MPKINKDVLFLKKVLPNYMFFSKKPLDEDLYKRLLNTCDTNLPCDQLHDHYCIIDALRKSYNNLPMFFKLYGLIHLIPFIVFKRKRVLKEPSKEIKKLLINFGRSMGFILFCCTFAKYGWCIMAKTKNLWLKSKIF